jgi:hypothetical protein
MKNTKTIIIIGALLLLPLFLQGSNSGVKDVSYLGDKTLPPGMRRNNPGNIRPGSKTWQGSMSTDGGFVVFETWVWGVRAMIILLSNYINNGVGSNPCVQKPQNTISKIIETWSPRYECGGDNPGNIVDSYKKYVSDRTGIGQNTLLSTNYETLRKLTQAMSRYEQGVECVTNAEFDYAYNLI